MDTKPNVDGDRMKKLFLSGIAVLLINGCANLPQTPEGFNKRTVETEHFSFYTLEKENMKKGKPLRFYIEGDGNPNPKKAIAMEMAQKDTHENIIYLARPCQFIENNVCENKAIYTTARFHREILKEMEELTVYFIKKYKSPTVEFIGYDGGGTIAMLLAPKIPITTQIITVAGLLDTADKNNPNIDILNPMQQKDLTAYIPQIHYVGEKDTIAPKRTAERFVGRLKNPRSAKVKTLPSLSHDGWQNVQFNFYTD